MKDEDRYKLLFGPYYPPKVRRGYRLFDEVHGTVIVSRYSDGEIPWPKRHGTHSLILCGDLVKAVRRESPLAISHWWGMSHNVVTAWRKALGVTGDNEGIRRLRMAIAKRAVIPDTSLLGTQPDRKLAAMWGLGITTVGRYRKKLGIRAFSFWRRPVPNKSLFGKLPDRKLASQWGMSPSNVGIQRRKLGIPSFFEGRRVIASKDKLLARRVRAGISRAETARRSGLSHTYYKTIETGGLRIIPIAAAERFAEALRCRVEDFAQLGGQAIPDESLLGKRTDAQLASLWRISAKQVRLRRIELGIPSTRQRKAIPDESLLGKTSDVDLARRWGLPDATVRRRRLELGIPSLQMVNRLVVSAGKLRNCHARSGVLQEDIARRSGLSSAYFCYLKSGRIKTITRNAVERFAAALGCRVEDFAKPVLAAKELRNVADAAHGAGAE